MIENNQRKTLLINVPKTVRTMKKFQGIYEKFRGTLLKILNNSNKISKKFFHHGENILGIPPK